MIPAVGSEKGRVGFFLGCAMNLIFADISRDTIDVLDPSRVHWWLFQKINNVAALPTSRKVSARCIGKWPSITSPCLKDRDVEAIVC